MNKKLQTNLDSTSKLQKKIAGLKTKLKQSNLEKQKLKAKVERLEIKMYGSKEEREKLKERSRKGRYYKQFFRYFV